MDAFLAILWALGLIVSAIAVFEVVGMRLMVCYFPEGRRPWHLPAQIASLAFFAFMVLINPMWRPVA